MLSWQVGYTAASVLAIGCFWFGVWSQETSTRLHHLLRRTTRNPNVTVEWKHKKQEREEKKLNKTLTAILRVVAEFEAFKRQQPHRPVTISAYKAKNYKRNIQFTDRPTFAFEGWGSAEINKHTCTPTWKKRRSPPTPWQMPRPAYAPLWTLPPLIPY